MIPRLTLAAVFLIALTGCGNAADEGEAEAGFAERMAAEHRDDAPVSNPMSAGEEDPEVVTDEVVYATVDGTVVTGFVARPAEKGDSPPPGVIVIHEWWGLNDNIRAMTSKLAAEGYVALAVDLYGGRTADDPQTARKLMSAVDEAQAEDNLRQAYAHLDGVVRSPRIASIGWCFGGGWSLRTALLFPEQLDASVIFYGRLVTERDRLGALEVPLLGLFGGQDQGIPVAEVRRFESVLDELGADAEVVVYPDADHAFANPSGRNYQAEAAQDAWARTLGFLGEHLGS